MSLYQSASGSGNASVGGGTCSSIDCDSGGDGGAGGGEGGAGGGEGIAGVASIEPTVIMLPFFASV